MKLNKKISIAPGFKRSINLIEDQSNKSLLDNYICPTSSEQVLLSMVRQIKAGGQSSFTWTGPYGAGKSSLALFVSALASGNSSLYKLASSKLSKKKKEIIKFFSPNVSRQVIPIIGCLEDPLKTFSKELKVKCDVDTILNKLKTLADKRDGLIIFVDEMGKFLEKASGTNNVDVYFFQQLAEVSNRSNGKIILVGILHQSFAEYSRNLPKSSRDEWIKIQGRFVDLAINAAGEEQIELISQAIVSKDKPKKISNKAKEISKLIVENRPAVQSCLESSLNKCWPLHPIVAALLGPVSRKRFGQNQRSIFSFLSSAEPFGFQHFLKTTEYTSDVYYTPSMYWDYLQSNLESAIIASPSSKMWAVAVDALNKYSVNSDKDSSVDVLKTIALIDIFKGTSGLLVTLNALQSVFPDKNIKKILKQLQKLSIIRFNKYSESFSLFEGSDFDIDLAVNDAYKHITDIDFEKLNQIASFLPVVAKRHYHSTGAMRWMNIKLVPFSTIESLLENEGASSFGTFSMVIPRNKAEYKEASKFVSNTPSEVLTKPIIFSVAKAYDKLFDFSRELLALDWINKNSSELSGDRIARKEVESRYSLVSSLLGQALEQTVNKAKWFKDSTSMGTLTGFQMTSLCSNIADEIFNKSPIIKTELLNRNKPSASANAALKVLLKKMVLSRGEERLGIEGFPAEGGLFKIMLEDTGLYSKKNKEWQYICPKKDKFKLSELWKLTDKVLSSYKQNFSLKDLYKLWSLPPFGVKKGLHAFLIISYLLTKKGHVAVYLNGTYIPEVNDLFIDYLVKNTADISLRYVSDDKGKKKILCEIAKGLSTDEDLNLQLNLHSSPLEVSRELVKLVDNLNPWVLRTRTLSKKTTKLRELLKAAHDPNKLIFDDLPSLYNLHDDPKLSIKNFSSSLKELYDAYPNLLKKLGQLIMTELQVGIVSNKAIKRLRERANDVRQSSGDFRIDALAARLATFNQTQDDIAGIASLAANKPIHDWIDLDVDRACIEIAVLCEGFKKAELYARVKGKTPNRHAIAFTSGLAGNDTVYQLSFDVLEDDKAYVEKAKVKLLSLLEKEIDDPILALTVITELSAEYIKKIDDKKPVKKVSA